MMNRRAGVTARFVQGEELRYLQAVEAAASHMYLGNRESQILVREDVATRADLLHEWLHRRYALRESSMTVGEEHARIEAFLRRHARFLRLDG
ncbi:MAG: hypothetical protein ACRDJE_18035 [Dehalococcoidia bacterium]